MTELKDRIYHLQQENKIEVKDCKEKLIRELNYLLGGSRVLAFSKEFIRGRAKQVVLAHVLTLPDTDLLFWLETELRILKRDLLHFIPNPASKSERAIKLEVVNNAKVKLINELIILVKETK